MFLINWLNWALSFVTFSVMVGDNDNAPTEEQQALLNHALQGDPTALGALYDQYNNKIYNYIYHRVGTADVAEDLTAQVFMKMLESIRKGRGWQTSFSGWLYRIAHNLVIDHYRRRGRATFVDIDDTPLVSSPEQGPEKAAELQFANEQVRKALNQLTEEQAQVITLRFLESQSITEAATIMNKTEGAIKALQYRAVMALRRVMQL